MDLVETLANSASRILPFLIIGPLMLIPFIVAEQIWPVHRRPGWRDYLPNVLISMSTPFLSLPFGIAAGFASESLRAHLPWKPLGFSYDTIGRVPFGGGVLEILAMTFLPLIVHDLWFYWAHRIEHKVPVLWEFHKLHHSDELMNCSTWARDHFLQATWIAVFPAFTLGLIFDISAAQAGAAAALSGLFISLQSMFYHSAIRARVPWLDRILVTPQVHRIHHSTSSHHYNHNFADALPLFDMMFGTYHKPGRDEFPETGLGDDYPAPRSLWAAQFGPALRGIKTLVPRTAAIRATK
jgi:sterol desaturase/sphingolipid hydroxylase (fatty acid hydroxylase superfamily)